MKVVQVPVREEWREASKPKGTEENNSACEDGTEVSAGRGRPGGVEDCSVLSSIGFRWVAFLVFGLLCLLIQNA